MSVELVEKVCTRCRKSLPKTSAYFYRHRRSGFDNLCKDCRKNQANKDYHDNKEEKSAKQKDYYYRNIEAIHAKRKEYYLRNAEKLRAYARDYGKKNKEKISLYFRTLYASNPQRFIDRNREYQKNNREKVNRQHNINWHKRRALLEANGGSFTEQEFLNLCKKYEWKCAYCSEDVTEKTVTIDHVVPLVKGGKNDIANILPACGPCNYSKGGKDLDEFLHYLLFGPKGQE